MRRRAPAAVRDFRRLPGSALPARQAGSVPNRKVVNMADKPVTANTVASGLMNIWSPFHRMPEEGEQGAGFIPGPRRAQSGSGEGDDKALRDVLAHQSLTLR